MPVGPIYYPVSVAVPDEKKAGKTRPFALARKALAYFVWPGADALEPCAAFFSFFSFLSLWAAFLSAELIGADALAELLFGAEAPMPAEAPAVTPVVAGVARVVLDEPEVVALAEPVTAAVWANEVTAAADSSAARRIDLVMMFLYVEDRVCVSG